ncbi:MAG: hypothetical protein M3O03_11230 [Pseudomonadota bacterium]|nr:hypothetical protein [Pseudomonadota bacterium]
MKFASKIMADAQDRKTLFGTTDPPGRVIGLAAGPLRVQLKGGNLGSIQFCGIEVVRGISFLVRDENWGTCPARVSGLKIKRRKNAFTVTYKVVASNGSAELSYRATITATPNEITFHAKAKPNANFKTNRTGFVVLHPIGGVAGKRLTVTHVDGTTERASFPKLISPGQPFFEIRALEHAPAPGLRAKVLMEGGNFEMEDQRNWTDASFKTYVCSLLDPWPYVLKGGEIFEQKVTLKLAGRATATAKPTSDILQIGRSFKLPEIGVAIPQNQAMQCLKFTDKILELSPKHLTCTLDGASEMEEACSAYAELCQRTDIPITLEIILPCQASAETEMLRVANAVGKAGLRPKRVVVSQAHDLKSFQPTDKRPRGPSFEEMAGSTRKHFPSSAVGGGMMSYFTELNRKRPPQGVFDFITHSICPIVHDASDEAVMQTLESLPYIFASTKAFIGATPYHLGPSSIGARMNPYGVEVVSNPKNKRVCLAPNDPRQAGTFASAWNFGLITAAAEARLQSITLSAISGPQALLTNQGASVPLFDMLTALLPLSGKRVSALTSSDHAVAGFITKSEAWIFNRTDAVTTFILNGMRIRLRGYETTVIRLG